MMSNENKNTSTSSLEKIKLFYEHTDDNRVVLDKEARLVKRPSQHTASRR